LSNISHFLHSDGSSLLIPGTSQAVRLETQVKFVWLDMLVKEEKGVRSKKKKKKETRKKKEPATYASALIISLLVA